MIRGPLELFRVVLIVVFLGVLIASGMTFIYHLIHMSVGGLGFLFIFIATLLFIFVLYRNKFQFHGFFRGKQLQKLSVKLTLTLLVIAVLLIIIAPIVS
ncbi:hypothetical protein [Sporolactobacillus nakayamae]|uniref:Uncharacterized protein n=1 Tax=Sporolactobacillus nakayamae TaxID=269670 RepID=A0A1I2N4F7_9BACL|nr:hypothetical protein [Sporolactobacillus nakayamae]SFF96607.1 hypothetical protein SAMN02982927_00175 [Sporolactobacillus nakayamae]